MRREELYLRDIVEAADHIADFIEGEDESTFFQSELLRSAILQKLSVIGEAAAHISDDVKARYAEVEWSKIVAFRNILVHDYFGVDWSAVWLAAQRRAPRLREQVLSILGAEFDTAKNDL